MIQSFFKRAAAGRPVYLTDVREAFQACGAQPLHLHVTLYDGTVRVFPLALPRAVGEAEAEFLAGYVHAQLYNILSALGAAGVDVYLDRSDPALKRLGEGLEEVFQVHAAKEDRTGFGRCLNVNERVLSALSGGGEKFTIRIFDVENEPVVSESPALTGSAPVFSRLPERLRGRMVLGMDVGGTDVKLAVSADGQLVLR